MNKSIKNKPFKSSSFEIFNELQCRNTNVDFLLDQYISKAPSFESLPNENYFRFYRNNSIINWNNPQNRIKGYLESNKFCSYQSLLQSKREKFNFRKFYFEKMNDFSFDIVSKTEIEITALILIYLKDELNLSFKLNIRNDLHKTRQNDLKIRKTKKNTIFLSVLPELDESQSNSNEMKEFKSTHLNSQNNLNCRNVNQNELILPRINEGYTNAKKNSTRKDNEKEKDLIIEKSNEIFKNKNGWTLSSNCSEDLENILPNSGISKQNESTTIELLPRKENLKKNRTSSTLLSYDPSFSNNSNSKISSHYHYQNFSTENLNGNTSNQNLRIKSTKKKKDEKLQNNLGNNRINLSLNNPKDNLTRRNSNISDYYQRQFLNKKNNQKSKDIQRGNSFIMEPEKKKETNRNTSQVPRSNTRETLMRPKTVQSNNQLMSLENQNSNVKNLTVKEIGEINKEKLIDENQKYIFESESENIDKDTDTNDFTFSRIVDWLKEVENCPKIYNTPSELDSNSFSLVKERSKEVINEWNLSEYGSLDDQIIEYNRVVDKTFHIIHKD